MSDEDFPDENNTLQHCLDRLYVLACARRSPYRRFAPRSLRHSAACELMVERGLLRESRDRPGHEYFMTARGHEVIHSVAELLPQVEVWT